MKLLVSVTLVVVIFLIGFITLMHYTESSSIIVRYDCRMLIGGWHPDVPTTVQKQCREKYKIGSQND
jgi:hypothetical protein